MTRSFWLLATVLAVILLLWGGRDPAPRRDPVQRMREGGWL